MTNKYNTNACKSVKASVVQDTAGLCWGLVRHHETNMLISMITGWSDSKSSMTLYTDERLAAGAEQFMLLYLPHEFYI